MKYLVIFLLPIFEIGCTNALPKSKFFHFIDNKVGVDLKLSLPETWVEYNAPKFLNDHLIFSNMVGARDSSSWIYVKAYKDESFQSADLNSLLNWQIEQEISGNVAVKLDKHLDSLNEGKVNIGVLYLAYPYGKECWYAREIIIQNKSNVIVIYLTDKMNEERLEKIFQHLKNSIKI